MVFWSRPLDAQEQAFVRTHFGASLDALLPRSTTGAGSFLLRPLTRDGGQMVRDGRSLYDTTYGAVKARLPLRDDLFFE